MTPPQVSGLSWAGSSGAISSLTLNFSSPLDPNYASDPSNYQIVNLARGLAVPIASVSYNATTDTVTVVPAAPCPPASTTGSRSWAAVRQRSAIWRGISSMAAALG